MSRTMIAADIGWHEESRERRIIREVLCAATETLLAATRYNAENGTNFWEVSLMRLSKEIAKGRAYLKKTAPHAEGVKP